MPFRATFDCLWCGTRHNVRGPEDVEGWAQLCPDCVGKAGDNPFLRTRLRAGMAERGNARASTANTTVATTTAPPKPDRRPATSGALDPEMVAYYEARAPEYDDWYLRRGRYSHGPIDDMAWAADLDTATLWLDALPWRGEIVELAAGTGWWSTLLASRGELWMYDAAEAPLDRARDRLVAHGLRAHLHVRDAWAEPDRRVDGLFAGFWLSHVPEADLPDFLGLVRRWLKPGGMFAFIDSLPDRSSGVVDGLPSPGPELSRRRLADGREFTITKVHREPPDLAHALEQAGLSDVEVTATPRFFVIGQARAGE